MVLDFVFVILLVSLLVACHSLQPESAQRVRVKIPGHAQALVTLVTHDRATGFRAEDTVDFSPVITLSRKLLLDCRDRGIGILPRRVVGALAVVIGIATLINPRIVVIRVVIRRVVAVAIWIPIIVRIKSRVIDEPEAVDEVATMSVPPMITAPVPIAMPIGRASRKDMFSPGD